MEFIFGAVLTCIGLIGFVIFQINSKIKYLKIRTASKILKGTVVDLRWEKGPMRNDYTQLHYAYVELKNIAIPKTMKLRYATNFPSKFCIGDEIDCFIYGGDLLYANAMDEGFSKYLPNKWPF